MATPSPVPENLKRRLKDSYDAIAEKYTAWATKTADIRLGYLEKLLVLLSPAQTDVLEIGCGAGIPTTERLLAHSPNLHITANELSSSQIALGKARLAEIAGGGHRVTWLEGDMIKLDFSPSSFDLVLGFYTLFHLPRHEQTIMLRKIADWLRPDGYMLVNFPADDHEQREMAGWMGEKGWVWSSAWSVDQYRHLIRETGLELVLDEVRQDNVKAEFLWVIAKKVPAV